MKSRIFLFVPAVALFAILPTLAGDHHGPELPNPPQLHARDGRLSLTLHAVLDAQGHDKFAFDGRPVAPILRASPGDTIAIDYVNDLPKTPTEGCAIEPCHDMTNLHFHGLHVSPNAPQDDVLTMMAMPGESLHYAVQIPAGHTPGLFWYHTHPHGESHRQALDGMSGAIVIEGMERYVPEVAKLPERILIVRGQSIKQDPKAAQLTQQVSVPPVQCGSSPDHLEEIFTVNGVIRPRIAMGPGERQFWRIVNATADRYLDVQLDGQPVEVVAMDGMPLAYHDPDHPKRAANHVLIPPAGRLEGIFTGPASASGAAFRTLCVNTGTLGDVNPEMVLADIVPQPTHPAAKSNSAQQLPPPEYKVLDLKAAQQTPPDFVVVFSEDKKGFYVNGQLFTPDAEPMRRSKVGTYEHWRIVNVTAELHPMHIHQVHFLAFEENNHPLPNPIWLDTVNVPIGGSVDVIMDFSDPLIRGMSLFHCHLLNHEDKGMMAKILFE